jgi:hypothetical protein
MLVDERRCYATLLHHIRANHTSTAERTIRARTEAEARRKAEDMVSEQEITDWEEQEDDIQIMGVEEV